MFKVVIYVLAYAGFSFLPVYAPGQQVSGTMELFCLPPISLDLHLRGFQNSETLVVHMWTAPMDTALATNTPHDAKGRWCTSTDQCEPINATIEFKKFNIEKRATGTYVVEFDDGRKQTGTFSVIRKKQKKPFLCE